MELSVGFPDIFVLDTGLLGLEVIKIRTDNQWIYQYRSTDP